MPRAQDTTPTDTVENGFAALEAKVEEIQVEASNDAGWAAEHAGFALSATSGETSPLEALRPAAPAAADVLRHASVQEVMGLGSTGTAKTMLTVFEQAALAALRFQTETFASFVQVRNPQDLVAAQLACGERALAICADTFARAIEASPTFAPSVVTR